MTSKAIRLSRLTVKQIFMYVGIMLVAAISVTLFAQQISAHGYVEGPASRAALCKSGQNTNCGAIVYEPQSLEAPKGFPSAGPADGQIASAAGAFPELDQQSATRWSKVNLSSGQNTFTWKLTAAHATASWKYYITNTNWNPNAALTRSSFDLTPFCSVNYGGVQPPFSYSNSCNVPARTGYHIILAVWEVADTPNAFYNVIDVNFGGSNPTDTQAPTAPSALTSPSKTATSIALSWGASTDNVGVTGYRIYRGSVLTATVTGTTLSYNQTGLTSNTAYTYSVKAIDSAGNESTASNSITVTTSPITGTDTQAPTAPGALHVMGTPTSTSLQLMWNASTDNVGVTGYRIYRGTTLVTTVASTATSYTVTGLTASTSYTFTVRAIDAAGNQSAASTVSATTAGTTTASPWAANTAYTPGTLVSYNGLVYECRQSHTSAVGWEPPNVGSLWLLK
ncbi:lytic polysaccharide monooxygenase [Paenibacillus sp. GSMTC-2017]|uniref:lytic polysaccharide monooxygenase n=1 Tax=Paenibacillus sp. GSMTC-2017 TaxID=2794350 RepID=UPI0018D69AD2|nr:lytic polysaccharide monooxygenase [Paenibacillus sp. GSMTC-2017]MBH5318296.1 lytic polysaccharide monooxygenase [Paenibacillus sp. GSMTC-2017]